MSEGKKKKKNVRSTRKMDRYKINDILIFSICVVLCCVGRYGHRLMKSGTQNFDTKLVVEE